MARWRAGGLAALVVVAGPATASADDLAARVVAGCLAGTSSADVHRLARDLSAAPYGHDRMAEELGYRHTDVDDDDAHPGRALRTETEVTDFMGWRLPGGRLEFVAATRRETRVSGNAPVSAPRRYVVRTCRAEAAAPSGRAVFEVFEQAHAGAYGVFTGLGRRVVSVFIDTPHRREVLLTLTFEGPQRGLPADPPEGGLTRLLVSDAGRPMLDGPVADMPSVSMTRAALLAALDRPAEVAIGASDIQPLP